MDFFKKLPVVLYDFTLRTESEKTYLTLTDLTSRVNIKMDKETEDLVTDDYLIQDGETPQSISRRFYGTDDYYWTIMHLNKRYDLANDWPMTSEMFFNYVSKKYPNKTKTYDPDFIYILKIWGTIENYSATREVVTSLTNNTITILGVVNNLVVGMSITGAGIDANTTITNIGTPVQVGTTPPPGGIGAPVPIFNTIITISKNKTGTIAGYLTCSTSDMSKVAYLDQTDPITMNNKWKINIEDYLISNNYFPVDTKVVSFDNINNKITLSNSSNVRIEEVSPLYVEMRAEVEGHMGLHHYTDEFGNVCDATYVAEPAIKNSIANSTIVEADINSAQLWTNYDYEEKLNESKRLIKIVKPAFISRWVKTYDAEIT